MTTITKATTKGQITLPSHWRRQFNTDTFLIETKNTVLEIKPLDVKKIKKTAVYTIFNAKRDNNGKGIGAKRLAKLISKTL